jgi:hypothetical protein
MEARRKDRPTSNLMRAKNLAASFPHDAIQVVSDLQ